MTSKHPQVSARLTAAQLAAVNEAARRAGLPLAEFIRAALAQACQAQGAPMPADMPTHGGERPRPPHQRR